MTQYQIYTFFLCLIVFVALTALFSFLLMQVVALTVRLIRHGVEDEKLLKEYEKRSDRLHKCRVGDWITRVFTGIVCIALGLTFAFSVFLKVTETDFTENMPSLKVVQSGSMSYKYEKNKHLFQNRLNDQLQRFDLIVTQPLPDEADLRLYDIVVYEMNGDLVIHRIVKIEEPNEQHPDKRYFTLQGDAVEYTDRYPVLYSQMRAIYRGQRIPFIGSFVSFMQSPAGWLCILLIVFALVASPLVEKKLEAEKAKRLRVILHTHVPRERTHTGISVPLSCLTVHVNMQSGKRFRLQLGTSRRVRMKLNHKGREQK